MFGEQFPDDDASRGEQLLSILTAVTGLLGFALIITLVEQVRGGPGGECWGGGRVIGQQAQAALEESRYGSRCDPLREAREGAARKPRMYNGVPRPHALLLLPMLTALLMLCSR